MHKILYSILLILSSLFSYGQGIFPSENGLFNANYLKGCTGTTITVDPQASTGTFFFCFDGDPTNVSSTENQDCFNDQANQTDRLSFTYNTPGIYTIIAFRQLTGSQEFDSLQIEIIEPNLPALSAINCNGVINFDLNSTEESYDFYTVDFGDGSTTQEYSINDFPLNHTYPDNNTSYLINVNARFDNTGFNNCSNNNTSFSIIPADLLESSASILSLLLTDNTSFSIDYAINEYQNYYIQLKENLNGTFKNHSFITNSTSGSFTFSGLDLNNNFYCARIISSSQCENSNLISNEICTLLLQPEATGRGNLLDWNSEQFESSSIFKNGQLIYTGNAPFLDENVLCGQTDSYYIESIDANGIQHTSLIKEVTAIFGNPNGGIGQISTNTLSDSELHLSWQVPQGVQPGTFIIYKKRSRDNRFIPIDSTNDTNYTDVAIDFNSKIFTYGISYTNNCGGESGIQTEVNNLLLSLEKLGENEITLNWNQFNGYPIQFDQYILRQYDENMNLLNSINLNDTSYTINTASSDVQLFNLQVEAYSIIGESSSSNTVSFKIPSTFFVPSAFSPDGNGLNDELTVLGKFIDEVEFSIYNRWGNLIFKSSDLSIGWDGFLPDGVAPEGTYSYIVTIKDKFGETYSKSGVFNLIR